jgi:hypothetical protein
MNMDSANKGIVAVVSIVGCALFAYLLFSLFGPEDKADTVTPVAAERDNTVEEHLKLDKEYHAACEDLKRVLEKCDSVLGECLHTLEYHAVMLPTGEEKP